MRVAKSDTRYVGLVNFPGYLLGDDGSVWSYWLLNVRPKRMGDTAHRLAPGVSSGGYHLHILRDRDNNKRTVYPHHMVLEIFHRPRPEGLEACHYNGIRTDNHLSNLRWDTRSANHADKWRHGTAQVGERHGMCRFAKHVPPLIRKLRASGYTYAKIAEEIGCTESYVHQVCKGKLRRNG